MLSKAKNFMLLLGMTSIFILLWTASSYATTGIVNTETLKLRKGPSTSSEILDLLDYNEKLEITGEEGDWYSVVHEGTAGYVSKQYMKVEEEEETQTNTQVNETTQAPTQNVVENTTTNTITETTSAEVTEPEETATQNVLKEDTQISILPLIQASKIGTEKKGTSVEIITTAGNWCYIATENLNGWVRQDALETGTPQTTTPEETTPTTEETPTTTEQETAIEETTMYVTGSSVYVRSGPGTNYEIVTSLIRGNSVKAVAETSQWYKVEVNGQTGYISKSLVSTTRPETTSRGTETSRTQDEEKQVSTPEEENTQAEQTVVQTSTGQQIVDYAKNYLGCKYVYGGSGPNTFDCSGFTMYVYQKFGVTLSHSARAQSKVGTAVEKENLQLGDLVFFKDYETMDGIGHCGIYIGDGNFIHASSGTGYCVKISTLLSGSYATRYETARRVI